MKPRTQFLIGVGLLALILGITWYSFSRRNQEPAQIFPSTVSRDCAPWDGSAFTVSVPMDDGGVISISIWKSPDIKLPVTLSFPDNTGQVGNATYQSLSNEYKQLNGKVFFWRVDAESPIEGEFDLMYENGQQFKGKFKAEWENSVMMCG